MIPNLSYTFIDDDCLILVDGKLYDPTSRQTTDAQFGIFTSALGQYVKKGQASMLAQFYELVNPGLILTRHIFRGLRRPLFHDGSLKGDKNKLIYSWKPTRDYEWSGGPHGHTVEFEPPRGAVFCVFISPNIRHKKFPVAGWIERWTWIDEDNGLAEAPINWVDRFEEKLYTIPRLSLI